MVVRTGQKRAAWISGYAEMMGMGMISGALGPLLAEQVPYFKLTLSQAGLPAALEGIGYLLGTLAVPFIWAMNRARWILLGSYIAVVLTLISIFFFHQPFTVYLVQIFLLGAISGVIIVAVDSFLSDLHRPFQAPYLNSSHLFYGLGAFFGPILVSAVLLWIGPWPYYFLTLTLVCAAFFPFLWVEVRRSDQDLTPASAPLSIDAPAERPFRSLSFWLTNMCMFTALGVEFGLATWQPLFLIRVRHLSAPQANICISFFWLALMAGRFLYIRLFSSTNLLKSVMAATLLASCSMLLAFSLRTPGFIMFFTAGIGLGMSILYPNLLALATTKFSRNTGLITGALSFGAGLGAIFMPWLLGPVSQVWGLGESMYLLPICGFATTLLVGLMWLMEARPPLAGSALEHR